jgi:aminotransferase
LTARAVVRGIELPPFDPLNRRAAVLRAAGHHVISLGQAVPFFAPPETALAAARRAIETAEVHRYVTDPGLPALRRALAPRLAAAAGAALTEDDVLITAGANHAFTLAVTTLVDAGDEVILPAPYFTNHQMAVCAAGAIAIEAPLADRVTFATRWADIEPHVSTRTRAVVLCNPSNPTGAIIDPVEGIRIVNELAVRGILVISDETYMQFVYEGAHWSAASVPGWRRNVVVIGTFSKSFGMMGWRVGYLLADRAVCDEAVKIQDAMIICAPVLSQLMAEAAVRDSWEYPLSFHAELRARRRVLAEGLARTPRLTWTPAPAGLFGFVAVDGCEDSVRLSNELLDRAHVVTIPGAVFGRSGEGCLRLSYGYATAPDIAEATDRLRGFLTRG